MTPWAHMGPIWGPMGPRFIFFLLGRFRPPKTKRLVFKISNKFCLSLLKIMLLGKFAFIRSKPFINEPFSDMNGSSKPSCLVNSLISFSVLLVLGTIVIPSSFRLLIYSFISSNLKLSLCNNDPSKSVNIINENFLFKFIYLILFLFLSKNNILLLEKDILSDCSVTFSEDLIII